MKAVLFASVTLLISSYSPSKSTALTFAKKNGCKVAFDSGAVVSKAIDTPERRGIVLVRLADNSSLHWDNTSASIVEDSLFSAVVAGFPRKKVLFTNLILDTTTTRARACGEAGALAVGDVAFLLIRRLKPMPYFKVLGVQLDVYEKDCHYPFGLFQYLHNRREEAHRKVKAYVFSRGAYL